MIPAPVAQTERDQIQTFFDHYAAAFERLDVTAITGLWTTPALIIAGDKTAHFENAASFQCNTEAICDTYRTKQMAAVEAIVTSIAPISLECRLVTVQYTLSDRIGAQIAQWVHGYSLRRINSEFRIQLAIADGEVEAWQAAAS